MEAMEYPNSNLIDPSTYDTALDGLCTPNFPLRVHRDVSPADRGALRAQRDWQRLVGPLPLGFSGCMGPDHNFVTVCMPEVLPERLELVAYFSEIAFIVDDFLDAAESPMFSGVSFAADALVAEDVMKGGGDMDCSAACPPVVKLMVGIGKAMSDIDLKGAESVIRSVKKMENGMMLNHPSVRGDRDFQDFDEYLEHRRIDVGSQSAVSVLSFGMGLSISEDQQQTCLDLAQSFILQASLANDYHSWERESKASSASGPAFVNNAIWILMNKHSMTCDEAKAACRERARQYAAEYEQVVAAARARDDLCQDAKLLLERFKLAISGNIAWGLQCPRFHADRKLNAAQLEMAEAIWADETVGWDHAGLKTPNGAVEHPGVESNGPLPSDAVFDRAPLDGIVTTSTLPNGLTNGAHTDGAITSGAITSGAITNGVPTNGVPTNGAALASGSSPLRVSAAVQDVPALGTEASTHQGAAVLEAPSRYIDSLPGKGIRNNVIDALNTWYKVPPRETAIIVKTIDLLHGASLLLDDIQDSSQLRRGKPAAHVVFGQMQTINSAGYRFLAALMEVRKLDNQRCVDIFCDELQDLYVGQSHDLAWTSNLDCPTEEEYLAMVDDKTAGLFRMLARMLDAVSDTPTKPDATMLIRFMTLLGRLFQIRDDYLNLTSADYTKQKGFCEDLDEGKYSLALIHALGRCKDNGSSTTDRKDALHTALLRNLLSQRHVSGKMSLDQKKLFLEYLEERGSLEYTRRAVDTLQAELRSLAKQLGMQQNKHLTKLLEMLQV